MCLNLIASLREARSSDNSQVNFAIVVTVISLLAFLSEIFAVVSPLGQFVAAGVILVVDAILIWLLWLAADTSVKNKKIRVSGHLPRRDAAAIQLVLFAITIVLSAACLYLHAGALSESGTLNSLYFSVVTIATVGYGDIHPVCDFGKLVAMAEIASGILLLVCAFPLVIARLSLLD